jgi:aryl-alcohol dehydrogenase-like predicted oxidoreductase
VIASKFLPLPTRLTRRQFMNALDASRNRLGLETIDLYYIHFPYTLLSIEKLMDLMAQAVEAGKIRAVGVSNFNAKQMRRAVTRLERYHIPLAANQVRYNLTHRQPEKNGVLDLCRELNVALVAYRPLEGGQLKSKMAPKTSSSLASSSTADSGKVRSKERILQETLESIAQQHRKSVSQVALNWLMRRDEHVIPIPGATNPRHALENADTLNWELSPDEFAAIDQASWQ